jgi:hypothetical protein
MMHECRFDMLQVAAVIYLKKLDELGEDLEARLAANDSLARETCAICLAAFDLGQ